MFLDTCWVGFHPFRSTYPETATRFGGLFVVRVDGCSQLIAYCDLVADTGCDDELRGTNEVFQVRRRVFAELEVTGVEVPSRRVSD